ncbi:MAG: Calx-beta domain-containing protein [Methylococcales bacterium]
MGISIFRNSRSKCIRAIQKHSFSSLNILNLTILGFVLSACTGTSSLTGEDTTDVNPIAIKTTDATFLSGSVGDGPIVQANIQVFDANGADVASSISGSSANYSVSIPAGTALPLLVEATGGIDVVTGTAPDFTMQSIAAGTSINTVNINPFTTIIVKTAKVMPGGLTDQNISIATSYVVDQLNFGFDATQIDDPIKTPINSENVASIVKSSEALGEAIRRTRSELFSIGSNFTEDDIINYVAADLTDGLLDGRGAGSNVQISATLSVVSGQVLIETLSNKLKVGGYDATTRMDDAITLNQPSASMTTADVVITTSVIDQARKATAAAIHVSPNTTLSAVAVVLAGLSGNTMATTIDSLLPLDASSAYTNATSQVANQTTTQQESVIASMNTSIIELATSSYWVDENDGTVIITVTRSGNISDISSIQWRTQTFNGYGTADFTSDYSDSSWTSLTFAAGESSKQISVAITDDGVAESDETFTILLQNPSIGSALGTTTSSVVTIRDVTTTSPVVVSPTPPVVVPPAPVATGGTYPAETTLTSVTVPNASKPQYLVPMTDPRFGTKVTRITDNVALNTTDLVHQYAKVPAWNSDGTLINMRRLLLDGNDYSVIRTFTASGELRWSNINPHIMYVVSASKIETVNVLTDQKQVLRTFSGGYDKCYIGPFEGNISYDDQFVALTCKLGNDFDVIVYNIQNDSIVATKRFTNIYDKLDWVTISPSGNYVILQGKFNSGLGVDVYDRNLTNPRKLWSNGSHGDLGYDTSGNEVYVQFPGSKGYINVFRLSDGVQTAALANSAGNTGVKSHISCRNFKRPGWCYVSAHDSKGTAMYEVFAVKLDASQTVQRFAHHHTTASSESAQARGVPSPDGTKVMFGSDWGGSQKNSYVAEMP